LDLLQLKYEVVQLLANLQRERQQQSSASWHFDAKFWTQNKGLLQLEDEVVQLLANLQRDRQQQSSAT
jgi:hypothetical protein